MSLAARVSTLADAFCADQDKDANSLLLELDKGTPSFETFACMSTEMHPTRGLRSVKVGEQCESIVRFPQLFEKYPFPILINSSFIKIANVFRVGSNILRLCILQVAQQSEKHLKKITNIDEFVRRIHAVIHSNDPIARALTLRTLGSVSCIIADRKNIHHSIISGLDSHDSVEVDAAIFAAIQFAAKSKSFASSICGKLADMIESLSVPLDMKLKLISVFEHMRCDVSTYRKAQTLCSQMLRSHLSCRFVLAILHTLTHLSVEMMVDIPVQIELLLRYFNNDVRRIVRNAALKDLHVLAQRAPHMWTAENIEYLCNALDQTTSAEFQLGIVAVLSSLCQSVLVGRLSPELRSRLLECCLCCCYHDNTAVVAVATKMVVGILSDRFKGGDVTLTEPFDAQTESAFTAVDIALSVCIDSGSLNDIKTVLKSIVQLCQLNLTVTSRYVDAIVTSLKQNTCISDNSQVPKAVSLCDCLSAIDGFHGGVLCSYLPEFVTVLKDLADKLLQNSQYSSMTLAVVRLLFQACAAEGLEDDMTQLILSVQHSLDGWMVYKIGRLAARYGHHTLASNVFSSLMKLTSSEHYYFWLSALKDLCTGESCLQGPMPRTRSDFIGQMLRAEGHYHTGVVSLKAAATPAHPLTFQIEYAQIRSATISVFSRVVQACCSFQTCPPPAIAASLTMTTGLEKHRFEHVVEQLKKCNKLLIDLDDGYQSLIKSSFDADSVTLSNVEQLQQMCRLMIHVINTVIAPSESESTVSSVPVTLPMDLSVKSGCESSSWLQTRRHILELLRNTIERAPPSVPTNEHMDCIQQTAVLLGCMRHYYPRFMFQCLQTTDIKMAVSPSVPANGDPILIHYDTCLTLKIEGVIQACATKGVKRFHNARAVELVVNTSKQASSTQDAGANSKKLENPSNHLVQVVVPHNDYFSTQFILSFPVPGLHDVHVDAVMVDRDERRWTVGGGQKHTTSLVVKSYNEAAQRQQHSQAARQHVPSPSVGTYGANAWTAAASTGK